jgi:hypothetical protein
VPFYIFDKSNVKEAGTPAKFDTGWRRLQGGVSRRPGCLIDARIELLGRKAAVRSPGRLALPVLALNGLSKAFGGAGPFATCRFQ